MHHHPRHLTTECQCDACDVEIAYLEELEADEDGVFSLPAPEMCEACEDHCCEAGRGFCGRDGCEHCGEAKATTSSVHGDSVCEACAAKERAA